MRGMDGFEDVAGFFLKGEDVIRAEDEADLLGADLTAGLVIQHLQGDEEVVPEVFQLGVVPGGRNVFQEKGVEIEAIADFPDDIVRWMPSISIQVTKGASLRGGQASMDVSSRSETASGPYSTTLMPTASIRSFPMWTSVPGGSPTFFETCFVNRDMDRDQFLVSSFTLPFSPNGIREATSGPGFAKPDLRCLYFFEKVTMLCAAFLTILPSLSRYLR